MTQKHLFGEWGGARTKLSENKGISFDFHYIGDFLANPHGEGVDNRVTDWGRVRGSMDVDFGKLAHVKGLTFHITGMWQNGTFLSGVTGAIDDASGIESAHGVRVDSFWLQQALFNNKLFLRAGQFAGMDFYGVQEYGGAHIIEALDYALGNLGETYESFDPFASPAAEVRVVPTRNFYVKTAALSGNHDFNIPKENGGVNGDPNGLHFNIRNHAVIVSEVGYLFQPAGSGAGGGKTYPGIYKFGSAWNGDKFLDPVTGLTSSNHLVYFMANQAVYRTQAGSDRGLDLEFAWDTSPQNLNAHNTQITGGFRYTGLIPKRSKDSLALGIVHTPVSKPFATPTVFGSENVYEVSYRTQVAPWWVWQPVVQVYENVGARHQGSAVVAGFRTFVDF